MWRVLLNCKLSNWTLFHFKKSFTQASVALSLVVRDHIIWCQVGNASHFGSCVSKSTACIFTQTE